MAFPQGFDFRNTSSVVTDTAPNTFWSLGVYPSTTPQGNTAGWISATGLSARDRSAQYSVPEMAGGVFISGTSTQDFRVDLPNAGTFTLEAGHGDSASQQQSTVEVFDNTTSLGKYLSNYNSFNFTDPNEDGFSTVSAWSTGNTTKSFTFSSTVFILRIGGSSAGNSWLNHLRLDASGGGTTIDQSLTTSLSGTAALSFLRGKSLSPSIALGPSLQRGMTKSLSASVGASPSLSALKAFLWSLSASVSASASLSRTPGKVLSATVSASASFAKSISHVLSVSIAGSPTVSAHKTSTTDQALTASISTLGTVTATDEPFSPPPIKLKGFPNVPEYLSNPAEQRRTISRRLNSAISGKINCTVDVTLNASATTTTLTDPRIGYYSVISPAMPMTSSGATALKDGIWIGTIVDGSAVINHASNAATDQTIRFSILG